MKLLIYTIFFSLSILISCQSKEEKNKINDTLIAKVGISQRKDIAILLLKIIF